MFRRIALTAIATLAALSFSAPAFASGVGQLIQQVENACQNISDGPGSCPGHS